MKNTFEYSPHLTKEHKNTNETIFFSLELNNERIDECDTMKNHWIETEAFSSDADEQQKKREEKNGEGNVVYILLLCTYKFTYFLCSLSIVTRLLLFFSLSFLFRSTFVKLKQSFSYFSNKLVSLTFLTFNHSELMFFEESLALMMWHYPKRFFFFCSQFHCVGNGLLKKTEKEEIS